MRVRALLVLAALSAAALTTIAGRAHQIDPDGCAGTVLAIPADNGAVLYVSDPDAVNADNGTWIYLESNSHKGLQRGGYNPTLAAVAGEELTETVGEKDRCDTTKAGKVAGHGASLKPDTIIF